MPLLHVVLDTNLPLSGIAFPASVPGRVVAAWRSGLVNVSLSEYILDELRRVMPKLKHRHNLSGAEIADFIDLLALQHCCCRSTERSRSHRSVRSGDSRDFDCGKDALSGRRR